MSESRSDFYVETAKSYFHAGENLTYKGKNSPTSTNEWMYVLIDKRQQKKADEIQVNARQT